MIIQDYTGGSQPNVYIDDLGFGVAGPQTPQPDFTVTATEPFLNIARNASGAYHLTLRGSSGFSSPVAVTVSGLPADATASVDPRFDAIAWADDDEAFAAWCAGETGYGLVDAGMRQLATTGYVHNRVRMVAASFLVKQLGIDWRRGERFFRASLLDGDVASNAGGWQWVAGTGPDAAPYFRVFNPTAQGEKFDPTGSYVRRWVPELAEADDVHKLKAGRPPGYPEPIVDHATERAEALARYGRIG